MRPPLSGGSKASTQGVAGHVHGGFRHERLEHDRGRPGPHAHAPGLVSGDASPDGEPARTGHHPLSWLSAEPSTPPASATASSMQPYPVYDAVSVWPFRGSGSLCSSAVAGGTGALSMATAPRPTPSGGSRSCAGTGIAIGTPRNGCAQPAGGSSVRGNTRILAQWSTASGPSSSSSVCTDRLLRPTDSYMKNEGERRFSGQRRAG